MMKKDVKKPSAAKTPRVEKTKISLTQKIKNAFIRPQGGLRTGWLLLCALILCRGVSYGLRIGLNAAFARLFSAWRVNASNIHLAPRWAQTVYSWHASAITVAVCLATAAMSLLLRRWWLGRRKIEAGIGPGLAAAAVGAGVAVVSAILFVIMDSVRPEWSLTAPVFSASVLVMLPVTLITAFSEELFTKCVVFDGIAGRWGRAWACAVSTILFFLFNGGYVGTVISAVNVLLMGVVCCLLYGRYGLWAASLFRGAWSYVSVFVAGFDATGAVRSVYALYGVSETWLTGGDGGLIYGLWMTFILAGMAAWMAREKLSAAGRIVKKRLSGVKKAK